MKSGTSGPFSTRTLNQRWNRDAQPLNLKQNLQSLQAHLLPDVFSNFGASNSAQLAANSPLAFS